MITTYRLSSFRCATSLSTQLIPSAPIFSPRRAVQPPYQLPTLFFHKPNLLEHIPALLSLLLVVFLLLLPPHTYQFSSTLLPTLLPSLLFGLFNLYAHSPSLFFQMANLSVHSPALLNFLLVILPYSPCKPAASHIPYLLKLLTYPPTFSPL